MHIYFDFSVSGPVHNIQDVWYSHGSSHIITQEKFPGQNHNVNLCKV